MCFLYKEEIKMVNRSRDVDFCQGGILEVWTGPVSHLVWFLSRTIRTIFSDYNRVGQEGLRTFGAMKMRPQILGGVSFLISLQKEITGFSVVV